LVSVVPGGHVVGGVWAFAEVPGPGTISAKAAMASAMAANAAANARVARDNDSAMFTAVLTFPSELPEEPRRRCVALQRP
jgi:hypothetical protein